MTDGVYAYKYDEAGNITEKGNRYTLGDSDGDGVDDEVIFAEASEENVEYWEYEFDLLNRLVAIEKNGDLIREYKYDPDGIRTVTVNYTTGDTIHYQYQGDNLIFEKNITTDAIKSYVFAFGKQLAWVDGISDDTEADRYFYHQDQVGSIRAVTDESGNAVWKGDYTPFGELIKEKVLDETFGDNIRFGGKPWDDETGLYYFNARYYDAKTGRFVSVDPVRDGLNWYVYTANNPLRFTDSNGMYYVPADLPDEFQKAYEEGNKRSIDAAILERRSEGLSDYIFQYLKKAYKEHPDLFEGLDEKTKALLADLLLHTAQLYLWSNEAGENWNWGEFLQGGWDQFIGNVANLGNEVNTLNQLGTVGYMLMKGVQGALTGLSLAKQIQKNGLFNLVDRAALGIVDYIKNNPEEVAGRTASEIVQAILVAKGVAKLSQISKGMGKYAPNRKLPRTKHGDPIPDNKYPHSQLGQQTRSGETFNQAREWMYDANGNLTATRRIDFSNHNSPQIHPNPHQHILTPNNPSTAPKGGYIPGPPEPLEIP